MSLIAVYGTLKKGHCNHDFLDGCLFIGKGRVYGYALSGSSIIPFAFYTGEDSDWVDVEVYEVPSLVEKDIDLLEGAYNKDIVIVNMIDKYSDGDPETSLRYVAYMYTKELKCKTLKKYHSYESFLKDRDSELERYLRKYNISYVDNFFERR